MKGRKLLVLLLVLLAPASARADEGGVSFWLPGQYASLAAVPATPGLSLPVVGYFFEGTASAGTAFTRGEAVVLGLRSRGPLFNFQPTYAPDFKIAGGQLSVGIGWGFGQNTTRADVAMSSARGTEHGRSDSVWGWTDLDPIATIAWASGSNNGMGYITGDIPVGSYDAQRLSNVGLGHGAIDFGGAYTYLDQKSGREASATTGVTFNFENPETSYENGVDWHLDWAVSQLLARSWEVGVVGYLYYQLTGDSGSGAKLGDFRSGVASVGAEGSYQLTLGGQPAPVSLRGYWEFWSQDRIRGGTVFATVVVPL
jgi:hypothetical protein